MRVLRSSIGLAALSVALALSRPASVAADSIPPYINAAVSDAGRLDGQKRQDADRKPAETVAFAGLKPGDKVADLMPGGGYFTRIFAKVVGPKGHVYAVMPKLANSDPRSAEPINAIAADAAYGNVTAVTVPIAEFKVSEPLDMVWTSRNYHDFKNFESGTTAMNKAIFAALKPGGIYLVLDHAAAPGAGFTATRTLHRSDPEAVKTEVLAAGFVLDGQSDLLKAPEDNHFARVFDSSVLGKTDQYILKFRKPAR